MRVCCSAYTLYSRFYWLLVRLLVKTKCILMAIIIIKKAKKSPVIHELSGSRLQIPRVGRIMMVAERLPAASSAAVFRFTIAASQLVVYGLGGLDRNWQAVKATAEHGAATIVVQTFWSLIDHE